MNAADPVCTVPILQYSIIDNYASSNWAITIPWKWYYSTVDCTCIRRDITSTPSQLTRELLRGNQYWLVDLRSTGERNCVLRYLGISLDNLTVQIGRGL